MKPRPARGAAALALATAALAASTPTRGTAAELLALYEFDEADAASFTDSSGNTTPTIVGGVTADSGGGRDGTGAAEFDGLGVGLTLPIDINPGVNPNITIGAWVRPNSLSSGFPNAPWGHDDGGWDRGLSTTDDGFTWGVSDGNLLTGSVDTVVDDWQFIAVTYRGNLANLHIDDNTVFSFTGAYGVGGTASSAHTDLAVGSLNPVNLDRPFNGHIENFFVYDDAITTAQIEAIRLGGPAAIMATLDPPGGTRVLRERWDFESGDLTGWTSVDPLIGDNLVFESGGQPAATASSDSGEAQSTAQGDYHVRTWDGVAGAIGLSDAPTGIIESDPFVLGDNAQFELLVGGGLHRFYGDPDTPEPDITAVTLEREVAPGDWEAIFASSGTNSNLFRDAVWDASNFAGSTVRLRVYDTHSGGWGQVAVDDIRYSVTADISDPTDTDGDGMGDAWETFYFGDLSRDGTGDFESPGDGLTDADEWTQMTLPNDPDTDDDGLTDGEEVHTYGTMPLVADSDGDGFDDGVEVNSGTDPNDIDDFPVRTNRRVWNFESGDLTGWTSIDPLIGDNQVFESGGQPALTANSDDAGVRDTAEGNYHVRTWDGQRGPLGLSDAPTGVIESEPFVLEPTAQIDLLVSGGAHSFYGDPDFIETDITAVTLEREVATDDWEMIFAASGVTANPFREVSWDADEYAGETVRLRVYDTHSGGWGQVAVDNIRYSIVFNLEDPDQPDDDGDGIGDTFELFYFMNLTTVGADTDFDEDGLGDVDEYARFTDPTAKDTDMDGLEDGPEITAMSDPKVADSDGDGLTDGEEVLTYMTSPVDADTDDDTWDDATEIGYGTDPIQAASFPVPPTNLWSVDIQAVDGPLFDQGEPVTMDGLEPNAAAAALGMTGFTWNAFVVQGHDLTTVDPSMQLANAAGDITPVTFSVFGTISGFTNQPNAQVITNDYLFVNAGFADPFAEWEISGLSPGGIYDFYAYGGIARDMLLTVDRNGDGNILDEVGEFVTAAGFLFDDVTAGADGKIIGAIDPGMAGEANWGGFQLLAIGGTEPVDTDGDGLTDAEEDAAGTDRFNPDTDGDLQSDGAEVLAALTDPLDASSNLRITAVDTAGGQVTLTWTSVPGRTYTVEVASTLNGWVTLTTVESTAAPATTTTATVDTIAAGQDEKQYRVLISE